MRTFGLVVEGHYDEVALSELMQKCVSIRMHMVGRPCGPKGDLMKRFPGFLEEFRYRSDINKALVIRDCGNKDPGELLNQMRSKIANRSYPFPVKLLVIVKELEAWLLADENAISTVTGRTVSPARNPERLTDPKERLKNILSDAGTSYTAEVARKIAAVANIDTIESRCPNFKPFREAVLDC